MVQIHSPRPYFQLRSLDYARDFGSRLRRPLSTSSSNLSVRPYLQLRSLDCAQDLGSGHGSTANNPNKRCTKSRVAYSAEKALDESKTFCSRRCEKLDRRPS